MKKITLLILLFASILSFDATAQKREDGLKPGPDRTILDVPENAKWLTKEANRPNHLSGLKSVFYFEDFETPTTDGALPEGWVQKRTASLAATPETDATTPRWFRNSASYGFENWGDYVFNGGASLATGYTAGDPANTDDGKFTWAISPEITIEDDEGDIFLTYWLWFNNAEGWFTNYHVRIKSDGAWISLFSVIGNANNTNLFSEPVKQSLNAFKGKTVQLAFIYEYTDGWQMAIDDIYVGKELEDDFGITRFDVIPDFGLLADNDVAVFAEIFSNGNNDGKVEVSLYVNDELEGTFTTDVLSITGSAEIAYFPWSPPSYGNYTIELRLPEDDFSGNNRVVKDVFVNHYYTLAEDFENYVFDDLGEVALIFPPTGWRLNDPAWVGATEQWPIFNSVGALLAGRVGQTEKALITPPVTITSRDDYFSFFLEGVNNHVNVANQDAVPAGRQGYSTFQLKYSTSANGPWANLGDPIPFMNQFDDDDNLIQSANGRRFIEHDLSDLDLDTYYFAFTTTSNFSLIIADTAVYNSYVIIDNILIGQDPENPTFPEIYKITIPLTDGEVPYKYFVVEDEASWDMGEWTGDPNRIVNVTKSVTLEDVWGQQPTVSKNDGIPLKNDSRLVTFMVDMKDAMIGETPFDPQIHKVYISGNFPEGFDWIQPGSNPLLELTKEGSIVPIGNVSVKSFSDLSIRLFPNPASGNVTINAEINISSIEVFSLLGNKVFEKVVNGTQFQFNAGSFENGIYIVRISTEQGISTQKLQIAR